jgi:hypothetical protein
MRPWIAVAYSAPVAAATDVFLIYPIGQGSFSDGMPLGISGTFNFMSVFQAEHNILMHPFHMLGVAGVFGGSLFSAMHGSLVTSSLIRETTENESANEAYRYGQEEETYNIVAAHGYFGRLIFQYASFNNSRSLHFFLAAWPVPIKTRHVVYLGSRRSRGPFAMSQSGGDFNLSDEILAVIPTDPYDQLDLARKITSMAIASRVSNLESQVSGLRQKLLEKDRLVHELEDRVSSFERLYHEADSSLKNVVDENMKLTQERDSLAITAKKLGRDYAKLEAFKRQLMQSLNDDNPSVCYSTLYFF